MTGVVKVSVERKRVMMNVNVDVTFMWTVTDDFEMKKG